MGYEPEDLPWEVPLIELGLDSLMAVRIKNRVEYDFDLPPIQLQAVRDANLYAVEKLIQYAIEHRDEVEQLHEYQQTQDARGDRGRAGRAAQRYDAGNRGARAGIAAEPDAPASELEIPPPPTDPSGPAADSSTPAAAAAQVLNQQAVAEALGSDVPPREAAERVTFATWAIVTGKSPGGIFNALPTLDDETAEKMAQRLSERAEGTITAEDVKSAPTIEALATTVRELPRGRRDRRFRPHHPGPRQRDRTRSRCSCSTPRAARRWSTSRC